MKSNRLRSATADADQASPKPGTRRWRKRLTFLVPALGLAALALAAGKWSLAQPTEQPPQTVSEQIKRRLGEPDESPAQRAERELARLAILDPIGFEQATAKRKTPPDVEAERMAVFSLSQPRAYSAEVERFKDKDRREKEKQARANVLDPVKHSGSLEMLHEEVRKKKERSDPVEEVIEPTLMSRNIPTRPAVKPPEPITQPRAIRK